MSCTFEARRIESGNRAIISYLELGEGETTTGTDSSVVLNGRASHNRSELVDGAGSQGSSLGLTSSTSPGLAAGLFERISQYLVSKLSNFSYVATFFFFHHLGFKNRVPGRSECEPVAANPCGNLWEHVSRRSSLLVYRRFVFFFSCNPSRGRCSRLLIRVWLCLIACLKIESQ